MKIVKMVLCTLIGIAAVIYGVEVDSMMFTVAGMVIVSGQTFVALKSLKF